MSSKKSLLGFVAGIGLAWISMLSLTGIASAAAVGFNFEGGNGGGPLSSTPAGVGGTSNWVDLAGGSGGPQVEAGLTVQWSSANAGWGTGISNNNNLTNGYLDTSDASAAILTVSGLNSVFTDASMVRDIFVYFGSDGAGRVGHAYLNPTFGANQTGAGVTAFDVGFEFAALAGDAGFTQTIDGTFDGTAPSANYAVFTIGAGIDSFSVAVTRPGTGQASTGLHGVEIVEVIPEPASLALMGLGGLLMLRRRN